MLISEEPVRVDIPFEPGEWVEFRRLSGAQVRKARKLKSNEDRDDNAELIKLLGAPFVTAFQEGRKGDQERIIDELEEQLQYRVSSFNVPTLLKAGIFTWSYDGKQPSDVDDPSKLIDERTTIWCAKQVIEITRPPTQEEEGNSSEPSTTS